MNLFHSKHHRLLGGNRHRIVKINIYLFFICFYCRQKKYDNVKDERHVTHNKIEQLNLNLDNKIEYKYTN